MKTQEPRHLSKGLAQIVLSCFSQLTQQCPIFCELPIIVMKISKLIRAIVEKASTVEPQQPAPGGSWCELSGCQVSRC